MKIKKRKISKKIIVAVIVAFLLVGSAAYIVYAQQMSNDAKKAKKPITYSGPTEQDKKDAADNKKEVAAQEQIEKNAAASTSSTKKQVTPLITNASQSGQQITVNSYVSGIFEDGGICTLIASKGSNTVTRTNKGFADATTTSCSPFFVDRSAFSESGSWSVKITYSSNNAEGTSQSRTLDIQ